MSKKKYENGKVIVSERIINIGELERERKRRLPAA